MRRIEKQIVLRVNDWIVSERYRCVKTLRELAETEENYVVISRELERLEAQLLRARKQQAVATLTLVEWLETLDHFLWTCAYCQVRPFQVMSHIMPLPQGGTTMQNCVPACHRCRGSKQKDSRYVQAFIASFSRNEDERALSV
jgi:hypothetical protein